MSNESQLSFSDGSQYYLPIINDPINNNPLILSEISSANFDGAIAYNILDIAASDIKSGYYLKVDSAFYLITKVEPLLDSSDLIASYNVWYVKDFTQQYINYLSTDTGITIKKEIWEERVMGDNGWIITPEGNSIFSNVAVRGEINATSGVISDFVVIGSTLASDVVDGSLAGASKPDVYRQDAEPTGTIQTGSIWYDTNDNNKTYVYDGSIWQATETNATGVGLGNVSNLTPQNQAQTGLIAGTTITGGGITLSGGGNIKGGQTGYDTGTGFFLGYSSGYKFSIGNSAANKLTWNGTDLSVTGAIYATSGYIGTTSSGWKIESDLLSNTNVGFYAPATSSLRENLLYVPSFEQAGWWVADLGGTTAGPVSTKKRSGTNSFLIYSSTGNTAGTNSPSISVTAGQIYAMSAYGLAQATPVGTKYLIVQISWYNSSNSLISTETSSQSSLNTSTWTRASVAQAAPAGATTAKVRVAITGNTSFGSDRYFIDDALFEKQAALTPIGDYFDGNVDNAFWTGVSGNSTSKTSAVAIYAGSNTKESAPFRVTYDGLATMTNANIIGKLKSGTGTYQVSLGNSAYGIGLDGIAFGTNNAWYMYDDSFDVSLRGKTVFKVGGTNGISYVESAGTLTIGSATTFSGSLSSPTGTIGGWSIGSTTLTGGNTSLSSTGVMSVGTSNDIAILSSADSTYRIWVGNATASSAPFSVAKNGNIYASANGVKISNDTSSQGVYGGITDTLAYGDGAISFINDAQNFGVNPQWYSSGITSTASITTSLGGTPTSYGDVYIVQAWSATETWSIGPNIKVPGNIDTVGRVTAQRFGAGDDTTTSTLVAYDASQSGVGDYILYGTVSNASYTGSAIRINQSRVSNTGSDYAAFYANAPSAPNLDFQVRGDGRMGATSTTTLAADYAEYFEWEDGNPNSEDRVGYSVIMIGNKIQFALEDSENIIGIISGQPAMVADSAWNGWSERYLKDEFARDIWEDYDICEWEDENKLDADKPVVISYALDQIPEGVVVPENAKYATLQRKVENPNFNPNVEYIPRSERKEWSPVGLVGKLRLLKGQPVNPRWIKMRDISENVEEWLVK